MWARGWLKHLTWKDTEPNQSELGWKTTWTQTRPLRKSKRLSFLLISFSDSCDRATCTSQRSQRAENEWNANLSWHVKLWLDQITKCSTVNGWAERLSFHAEGRTRFSYQHKPMTLLVSIMQPLIDKIIARFQSNISWEFTEDSLYLVLHVLFFPLVFNQRWATVGNVLHYKNALSNLGDSFKYEHPFLETSTVGCY